MSTDGLEKQLGIPETAEVLRIDGGPLGSNVPRYLVRPASPKRAVTSVLKPEIRLVDFGEAFLAGEEPKALRTPLALRAPEALFEDSLDYRVDLWSAGCAVRDLNPTYQHWHPLIAWLGL